MDLSSEKANQGGRYIVRKERGKYERPTLRGLVGLLGNDCTYRGSGAGNTEATERRALRAAAGQSRRRLSLYTHSLQTSSSSPLRRGIHPTTPREIVCGRRDGVSVGCCRGGSRLYCCGCGGRKGIHTRNVTLILFVHLRYYGAVTVPQFIKSM